MDLSLANILGGLIGVFFTIVGVILSWYAGRKSERATNQQQKLASLTAASEWLRDLRNWASEAIEVLAVASYICKDWTDISTPPNEKLLECRYRLSALIDRGRFFLPNIPDPEIGAEKPEAYRGWRHKALDPLVAAEMVLSGNVKSGSFETHEKALIEMRREFVSCIQRVLAPDMHNKEIARLIRESGFTRSGDQTLGGLLPAENSIYSGAAGLIWQRSSVRNEES